MIDGGTFQVGLTVMYFIVSVRSGVAWLPGLPVTTRVVQTGRTVLHHLQRIVGDVEDDIGVADRRRAELARQPAPTLHVDDHRVDLPVALRAVDRLDGAVVQHAGGLELGAFLEFAHGVGDLGVVMGVVGVFGDAELCAQLRHARIFRRNRRLLLGAGPECKRRSFCDHRSPGRRPGRAIPRAWPSVRL